MIKIKYPRNITNRNREIISFMIIGIINTIIGYTLMLIFYNFFKLSYWKTSFLAIILMIVLSYYLNKNITFKNRDSKLKTFILFCIHILICYLFAYKIARFIVFFISLEILGFDHTIIADNVAMFLGMLLFTVLNFIGQKFWVFKTKHDC